jgi:ketopantoate reductase
MNMFIIQSLKVHKETELDGLSGAVIQLADKYGVKVPVSRILYLTVKLLEEASA